MRCFPPETATRAGDRAPVQLNVAQVEELVKATGEAVAAGRETVTLPDGSTLPTSDAREIVAYKASWKLLFGEEIR